MHTRLSPRRNNSCVCEERNHKYKNQNLPHSVSLYQFVLKVIKLQLILGIDWCELVNCQALDFP